MNRSFASIAFVCTFLGSILSNNGVSSFIVQPNKQYHVSTSTTELNMIGGLFQGMFENNILTFNPGWDANAQNLDEFTDVRELQRKLKAEGVEFFREADETTEGPEHFVVIDPDGNPILVDQHR